MHTKIKRLPFLVILLLYGCGVLAQANADKTIPLFFEKAYLHTDREQYAAGEDIWFKAYVVNAQDNKLIGASNNLYVELIAPGAVVRDRKIIRLDDGIGQGDFKLSDSLYAGTYRLRAYTNWMRNFGDNFVFEKEIKIYGGKKSKSKTWAKQNNSNVTTASLQIRNVLAAPIYKDSIQFFPEGGSMVENVPGIIAYKAEDSFGLPVIVKGDIETQNGQKVADLSTLTGSGLFKLMPLPKSQYFAKGQYGNGQPFNICLPAALSRGLVMHIDSQDSVITVSINTNAETFAGPKSQTLLLTCKRKGKIYQTAHVKLTGLQTNLQILKSEFPQGIICFTLYDFDKRPNCERLVYVEAATGQSISLASDRALYAPRQKVTLTVKAPVNTKISIAITDAGIAAANQTSINAYLDLQSEIRGKINNPGGYFDLKNNDRQQQLDLLLMTQGWRDFVWRRLADSTLKISYMLERGITLSGYVKTIWSEKPEPNLNVTLFADSAVGTRLFSARTDANGKFFIDGINLYGNQRFSLNAANDKGKKTGWVVMDTVTHLGYPVKRVTYAADALPATVKNSDDLTNRATLARRFSVGDTIKLREVEIKSRGLPIGKLYADTAVAITRDKYRYQTLGSCVSMLYSKLRPKLPNVKFKFVFTIDSVPHWRKQDTAGINFFQIPINQILYIRIRPITLWGQPSYAQAIQGFVSAGQSFDANHYLWIQIAVKPHAFDKFDFHSANLDIDGYYNSRVFYAPKYDTPDTRPDYRTTIYWEPNIVTDAKGEATVNFYNADPKTKVRVVAEGVTEKGVPVFGTMVYEVK